MNKNLKTTLKVLTLAATLLVSSTAGATTLNLVPSSGALSGPAGARLGWGFTLTNTSGFDLYVNRVYADGTLYGTNGVSGLGLFFDEIQVWSSGNGLVVAAGSSFSGTYSANGLASFLIDAGAAEGAVPVTGLIYLDYELYDSSLNFQGQGTLTAQGTSGDVTAEVSVSAPVPELDAGDGMGALTLLLGSLGLTFERRRKAKAGSPAV